ncbi:MAG: hypothetical protein KJ626_05905 [Verrucomicrobia bacterium]|nr:hypothetical protein [Verrucomicrobiota bacterium]
MRSLIVSFTVTLLTLPTFGAETLVDRLLSSYEQIETVTCAIRKTVQTPERDMRHLSRVSWQRPDRIHVENFAPLERRYVADGNRMFYYVTGDPKGFSRPIEELDEDWQMSLRKVPGSAMDHLLRLKGSPETDLPATDDFPVRKGYQTDRLFAVLSLDEKDRLVRIEFFKTPAMEKLTAQYDYEALEEPLPGVWLSALHKATIYVGDVQTKETSRFDNLVVNEPIPERLFIAEPFFKGVEFVDSFEAVYR